MSLVNLVLLQCLGVELLCKYYGYVIAGFTWLADGVGNVRLVDWKLI